MFVQSVPEASTDVRCTGSVGELAVVGDTSSAAESGGGAARHARTWPSGRPAAVADCRQLRTKRRLAPAA